ncbi:MAG: diguanylate cyclase [Gemmatimonas sp.]|nr:diguanylate cyclase [Gemmatimonas sp.]
MNDQLYRLLVRFESLPPAAVLAGGFAATVLVGFVDLWTTTGLDLSVLYIVPIVAVSWRAGAGAGLALAAIAAVANLAATLLSGRLDHDSLQAPLSILLDVLLFTVVAVLADALGDARTRQRRLPTDPVTGLGTSDAFYEEADRQVGLAIRHRRPITLAYIGVGGFSALKADLDQPTEDEVLISIAWSLRLNLRETDLLARVGPHEFAIVLPETGSQASRVALEKVREKLWEATKDWPIRFSIGVATCDRTAYNLDELMRRGETLMRVVKLEGGNRFRTEVLNPSFASEGSVPREPTSRSGNSRNRAPN